jgi:hypothetical protein
MYAFLAAHWKPILSVGFIFGILSLVLKFLDERLSQDSKDDFNEWVDGLAIHLDDLRLSTMYNWIHDHRVEYTILYAIPLIIVLYKGSETANLFPFLSKQVNHAINVAFLIIEIPFFTVLILYVLDSYLSQLSVAQSAKHYWKRALQTIVAIELFVMVTSVLSSLVERIPIVHRYLLAFVHHYLHGYDLPNGKTELLQDLGVLTIIAVLSLFVGVTLFLPLLIIVFLQAPIAAISKAVWWLATYKKGAWAGFVFALTMLLSILGLFK